MPQIKSSPNAQRDAYQVIDEKFFKMKKALKFRQERFKDVNLKVNQNINLSKLKKSEREILEKGLLEEWTVEGTK